MVNILNATDINICNLLVADAKMTMKILGEKVFLSEEATRKRVKKLEDKGFILGYHAELNSTPTKPMVSGNNLIKLVSNAGDSIERFMMRSMEIPQIINCQHVVADGYDFIVTIEADNLIDHNQILSVQLCLSFNVHPVSTSFVLSETKGRLFNGYLSKGLNKIIIYLAYLTPFLSSEGVYLSLS
jgi:Lrp/AsnC family leucine-responsive transcriptional regulator